MPEDLTAEEYKALTVEWVAVEERYDEAVLKEEAWAAKLEALKQQELEREKEWLQLVAEEQQWQLDLVKKEQKKAEKAVKAVESGKGKAAAKDMEAALVDEKKGTDVDTKRKRSEDSKKKALKKLKEWAAPTAPKRKCATKSTSVVEKSDGESRPSPSKRVKAVVSGPVESEEEFNSNISAGDVCVAIKMGLIVLHAQPPKNPTMDTLANKVDVLMGQVVDLQSCMDNLADDFQLEEVDSPEELISNMEEWQVSCAELKDLKEGDGVAVG
ncbi:hypothetical protein ARMSODRAFT_974267 [Armillaria solidipes]|uniref:Uncharacterized protein n=1 Tax=Armillaria solidipes TaxID=1076256 RepID=A0A2H3BHG6_9AGAR|nr:hypothetical protein ARMSODRAFT_974267 [Armillaria solidipes]